MAESKQIVRSIFLRVFIIVSGAIMLGLIIDYPLGENTVEDGLIHFAADDSQLEVYTASDYLQIVGEISYCPVGVDYIEDNPVVFSTQSVLGDGNGNLIDKDFDYCSYSDGSFENGMAIISRINQVAPNMKLVGMDRSTSGGCSSVYQTKEYGKNVSRAACSNPSYTVKELDLSAGSKVLSKVNSRGGGGSSGIQFRRRVLQVESVEDCISATVKHGGEKMSCSGANYMQCMKDNKNIEKSPSACVKKDKDIFDTVRQVTDLYGYIEYTGKAFLKQRGNPVSGANAVKIANAYFNNQKLGISYAEVESQLYFTEHTIYKEFEDGGFNTGNDDWAGYKAYLKERKKNPSAFVSASNYKVSGVLRDANGRSVTEGRSQNSNSSSATVRNNNSSWVPALIDELQKGGFYEEEKSEEPNDLEWQGDMASIKLTSSEKLSIQSQKAADIRRFYDYNSGKINILSQGGSDTKILDSIQMKDPSISRNSNKNIEDAEKEEKYGNKDAYLKEQYQEAKWKTEQRDSERAKMNISVSSGLRVMPISHTTYSNIPDMKEIVSDPVIQARGRTAGTNTDSLGGTRGRTGR